MSTEERLQKLEDEIKCLRDTRQSSTTVVDEKKKKKSGVKREASTYNLFVKSHIEMLKSKAQESNGLFNHKEAFKAAAIAWNEKKVQDENKE